MARDEPHTTNYVSTFIAVAPDCPAEAGTVPPRRGASPSVAERTYELLVAQPYELTSDDVIFAVYADRHGIAPGDREQARVEFFGVGRPCLRSSDLAKRYGWGIHSDEQGRVALYGVEAAEYAALAAGRDPRSGEAVTVTRAMRSRRR